MKKIITLLTFLAFMLVSFSIIAQDSTTVVTPGTTITTLQGLDLSEFFVSLSALLPLIVFVAAAVNKLLKTNSMWRQVIAWLVAIGLSFAGHYLNLGFLAGIKWYIVLIYGICLGLCSNGFFDITLIQNFLKLIGLGKPKE